MVDVTAVLAFIPAHLDSVEDYLALTASSRAVRVITERITPPHVLLHLCHRSQRVFFRPSGLFLLTALARPLSLWARKSTDNLRRLVESFPYGEEAVLDLAVSIREVAIGAKWSMETIRELWLWRMRVVNPLTDLIDKCVGEQWYATPDFWDGGCEDAATLYAEPNELVFRMMIYGELFGDGWEEWLKQASMSGSTVSFFPERTDCSS
jgi:hypothetical protein